jgi:hypothetical protein
MPFSSYELCDTGYREGHILARVVNQNFPVFSAGDVHKILLSDFEIGKNRRI